MTPQQQHRLQYKRAKWRASCDKAYAASARKCRAIRKRLGVSQSTMAKTLNVSLRTYKRREAGQSIPRSVK